MQVVSILKIMLHNYTHQELDSSFLLYYNQQTLKKKKNE